LVTKTALTYKVFHFGDTHLGRKHPSQIRKERVQSTVKAFRYCIDKAIEEDVDFVIHAGDVFDTVYPWHTVIEHAKNALKKLEEAEIPMYVIRGNHDRSFGQGRMMKGIATEHLESDWVHLIDPQAAEFPENGFIDHDENIRIYGLGYHANKTARILEDFEPESDRFNFLLLHDFIDGVTRSYSENTAKADNIAGKDLDYVAIGHDHQPNQEERIGDTVFAATGGTVDYDFNTTQFGKGYNILEVDAENHEVEVEEHEVPQELELKKEVFDVEDSREEIKERIESQVEEGKKYAFKLKITGETDAAHQIPTQEISEDVEQIEGVILAETILDVQLEGVDEYDSKEGEQFNVEEFLEEHLQNNSAEEEFKTLHSDADSMLSNEENLTSSGFSLKKDAKKDLRRKIRKELFPGDEE
jgi:exonuclease SbcD